jgi:hypothetical protein
MQRQDNIISFDGQESPKRRISLDANSRRLIDACRKLVVKMLPQLMAGLFEKLDDAMYELADKSEHNSLQSTYFNTMRDLRKDRVRIDREFCREVLDRYDRFWETGEVDVSQRSFDELSRESEMSLLDDNELEDSLALVNMISKGENRYSRELYALGRRFAHIANLADEVSSQNNPLAPAVICTAFQESLRSLPVELPVKLIIYKQFDKQVMHYVGGLYDELNLLLGKAGVIAKLTPRVRRNPVAPAVKQAKHDLHGDSELSEEVDELQAEVFERLQGLLANRRGSSSYPAAGGVGGVSLPSVDTVELLGALSALQQSNVVMVPFGAAEQHQDDLRQRLDSDLRMRDGSEVQRALGDMDNDTIDVISMLFEFILDDHSLPDAMKALLSRLQIPMLKVAIIDKTFFSRKVHPARQLLNNLAQAAIGWNEASDRKRDLLYQKIESVVKAILTEFVDDPSIFTELNDDFSSWWEKEQRGADIAEQRTTQVSRGKEQLRAAKLRVTEEINSRLQMQPVIPHVVIALLKDGWKDVMLLNYLRQGPDSDDWKESLEIVDKLLWSVRPKEEYAERQELLRNIPELLRNLRERLNSISFDQHKMARLFKELQNCHISCLRGKELPSPVNTAMAVAEKQVSFPDSRLLETSSLLADSEVIETPSVPHDEFTEIAENLEVGTWLEMDQKQGDGKLRVKLSWKSDVSDAYIFVNRKGVKALDLTVQGLAARFREGSARLLSDGSMPIMDRALDAMLGALHDTREGAVSA